jgi:hypothetical protein
MDFEMALCYFWYMDGIMQGMWFRFHFRHTSFASPQSDRLLQRLRSIITARVSLIVGGVTSSSQVMSNLCGYLPSSLGFVCVRICVFVFTPFNRLIEIG